MDIIPDTDVFLNKLSCGVGVQFTDCKELYTQEDAMKAEKNMYFIAPVKDGVGTGKMGRCNDADIKQKNYMVIDFDVRDYYLKRDGKLLTDYEVMEVRNEIDDKFKEDEYLSEWSYVIFSGNGRHVYYIGDTLEIDSYDYSLGVRRFFDFVTAYLGDSYGLDRGCCNISRLMRLPGTKNYSRKIKYDMEPMECQIIYYQDKESRLFNSLPKVARNEKKRRIKRQQKMEESFSREYSGGKDKFKELMDIPVHTLFSSITGARLASDGKNFISPKDGDYIGAFYSSEHNLIINVGTHYLSSGKEGYSTFTYIKDEILGTEDNAEVFKWAEDNFPHIKELADKEREEYIKSLQNNEVITSDDVEDDIDELFSTRTPVTSLTWGLPIIDKRFGRPDVNDLVILAARAGAGKTAFAYFMAKKNAMQGIGTTMYTLEINPHNLKLRTARQKVGISKYEFQNKMFTEEQGELMKSYYDSYDDIPNFDLVGFAKKPNIEQLIESIEEEYKKGKVLFFIDNLGNIHGDSNENARLEDITNKLQSVKNRLDICIVLIHHMSKSAVFDESKPIGLAGFRGTMKIIDNATIVVELWRDFDPSVPSPGVVLSMLKDTFGGVNAKCAIEYHKGEYTEASPGLPYIHYNN